MIVAGTGSRRLRKEDPSIRIEAFKRTCSTLHELNVNGDVTVMSGMAEGFDQTLAVAANFMGIPWIAAVPNTGYGSYYWGKKSVTGGDRLRDFTDLLSTAQDVIYVCGDKVYQGRVHSNFIRNTYMVEQADHVLVWEPTSRGTSHCVKEARRLKKPFTVLSDEDQITLF